MAVPVDAAVHAAVHAAVDAALPHCTNGPILTLSMGAMPARRLSAELGMNLQPPTAIDGRCGAAYCSRRGWQGHPLATIQTDCAIRLPRSVP
jgi:hypothetical protein